jgi:hypothetical protein
MYAITAALFLIPLSILGIAWRGELKMPPATSASLRQYERQSRDAAFLPFVEALTA